MAPRSILIAALSLALGVLACALPGTAAPTATPTAASSSTATPTPASLPTGTPTPAAPDWPTYINETHGFSIDHPPEFTTPPTGSAETFGAIGDQIVFDVNAANPEACRGACPVIEATTPVTIAGLPATQYTGYIGAIGGNVPQQYQSVVFTRDGLYYTFTLYAVPTSFTTDDISLQPLQPEDVALFEQMLATFQFTN